MSDVNQSLSLWDDQKGADEGGTEAKPVIRRAYRSQGELKLQSGVIVLSGAERKLGNCLAPFLNKSYTENLASGKVIIMTELFFYICKVRNKVLIE